MPPPPNRSTNELKQLGARSILSEEQIADGLIRMALRMLGDELGAPE